MDEIPAMTASVDESCRFLAARYVRKQAKQLAEQLDGVRRAEDIEFVHQARVASRRLRAAMRIFGDCFDPRQLKRWRKQIRRVTAGMGEARDTDVQIEFLRGVLAELPERACYPGIARLLVKLEQRRERLQPKTVKAADRLQASGVLEEMLATTKQVLADAKAKDVSVQSPAAFRQTRQHILQNLDQVLKYRDSLADPEDQQRHHAMRIAAKRLRYTTEISKPVHEAQLDGTIAAVKRLQTLLGEIHDCDVWTEQLQTFAAKQRKRILKHFGHPGPFARLETGIDYLQQERCRHRQQVFGQLVDYWQELDRQGQWGRLAGALRDREAPAQQPPPPDSEPQRQTEVPTGTVTPGAPGQ